MAFKSFVFWNILCIVWIIGCAHTPTPSAAPPSETGSIPPHSEPALEALPKKFREEAISFYRHGDYIHALQYFEAADLVDPLGTESKWRPLEYYSSLATGNYELALSLAQQLAKQSSYQALPYEETGIAQLWLNKNQEALLSFQRALEFDSHAPKLHFYAGLLHERLGKKKECDSNFETAEREYRQILKKNPKDFATNFELAALLLYWNRELEDVSALIKSARQSALESENDASEGTMEGLKMYTDFYLTTLDGILAYRQAQNDVAEKDFLAAWANAPAGMRGDLSELLFYLSRVTAAKGDVEGSKALFSMVSELDPGSPYVLLSITEPRAISSDQILDQHPD